MHTRFPMTLHLSNVRDRNIGFAATQGMTEDIGLQGSDLNVGGEAQERRTAANARQIAVSIFYITYILAEVGRKTTESESDI